MIKVNKLETYADITSVKLNTIYLGKILPNKLISLNKQVKGKLLNKEKLTIDSGLIPVRIVKINLPLGLDLEYIEGEYELIEKTYDIASFSINDIGKEYTIHALVESIRQTTGPTIFTLFDGTGSISAKSFSGPGKRTFPELEESMAISAKLQLKEYDNKLEAELLGFRILEEAKQDTLKGKIENIAEEKATPSEIPFLITSEMLNKLKPKMLTFAKIVKKAILESRPIILRHHADCDGYCGGIALERSILPLIMEHQDDPRAAWKNYKRAPSKAPFYEYTDVVKDLTYALDSMERFGSKEPLVILVDNGGTDEDIPGIKKMKIYGCKVIVVDHHYPGEMQNNQLPIDPYVDLNVNPYAQGGDMNLTAGMIATEIARLINNEVENIEILPALAGIGDYSSCQEFNDYLKIAEDKGFSREYLTKLAKTIDFEAYYLRFIESRGLVNDLLGADQNKQKELVELILPDIESLEAEQLKSARHYCRIEEKDNFVVVKIDIEKVNRRGNYPPAGKATGLLHDAMKKEKTKPVITLGIGPDFITFRASEGTSFNIHEVITALKEKMPHGSIEGGGHEVAGTIKFIQAAKDGVLAIVDNYLQS